MCFQLLDKECSIMAYLAILAAKGREQVNRKQSTCVASILNSKKAKPSMLSPEKKSKPGLLPCNN